MKYGAIGSKQGTRMMKVLKGWVKVIVFLTLPVMLMLMNHSFVTDNVLKIVPNEFNTKYLEFGESNGLPNTSDEYREWLETVDFDDIGDYYSKEQMERCLDIQDGNVLQSIQVPVKVTHTSDNGSTSVSYADYNYTLDLYNATKNYTFPWQLTAATELYKSFDPDYDADTGDVPKIIEDNLTTRYYGLYGEEGRGVDKSNVSQQQEFVFNKTVIKDVKTVNRTRYTHYTYRETPDGIVRESHTRYRTNTTTEKIKLEYPLPYFTKIKTYNTEYTFDYELKTTRNTEYRNSRSGRTSTRKTIVTTTIVPVLKRTTASENQEPLILAMQSIQLTSEDIELLSEYLNYFPDGVTTADEIAEIGALLKGTSGTAWTGSKIDYDEIAEKLGGEKYTGQDVIEFAMLLEELDYFWGGKYNNYGFNPSWGTIKYEPTYGRHQKYGLDCSGYVDWVYYQLVGQVLSGGAGVRGQVNTSNLIDVDELQIGDLGFYHIYQAPANGNHVGIYIGRDEEGTELFIHCGGSTWGDLSHPRGQVIVSKLNKASNGYPAVKFKYFGRPRINELYMVKNDD